MPDLSGYRFTRTHEWVRKDGDQWVVGITDHAQQQLGDVIFVELPSAGTALKAGDRFGTVESVKAASDLFSPVGGTVAAVNDALTDTPEKVNADPYGDGWLMKLESVDESGAELMDEAAYEAMAGE